MTDSWMAGNTAMLVHIVVAMVLGWVVGYERFFNGRVSGTQVYCLVSMTSAAVVYLAIHPALHGLGGEPPVTGGLLPLTGSILTGIGFLGAGILIQSGTTVRGLTTAASIWSSSAIGILVGAGYLLAGAGLTLLFVMCTVGIARLERRLPAQAAFAVTLSYRAGHRPDPAHMAEFLRRQDLVIPHDSVTVEFASGCFRLQCVVMAHAAARDGIIARVAAELPALPYVESFTVSHSSRA